MAEAGRKPGTPGAFSRWTQKKMNARMIRKVRGGKARFMGMDVLVLHTVGSRSGQPRETPVAWFGDGDAWLSITSGGGSRNPDLYANLMAHPEKATIELFGRGPVKVEPHRLDGAEHAQAWRLISTAQPRIAKYQSTSERLYPIVGFTAR
ncbi:nitroreductase family deazaflavin-dependent oxidoreductase [Streptomyces sp. NPDC052016]|uniref:nitroreductase family deazaflavin-dependent oxidoreductase n=1 Tax=Streptomyces sp. NPDC052016 TaxID=3365680 RepID=UPI0037CD4C96